MSSALTSLWALRPSVLRTARLALHRSSNLNVVPSRGLAAFYGEQLIDDMGLGQPRPTAPDLPPRGPISYESMPNPVTPSKFSNTGKALVDAPPKYHFFGVFSKNNTKVFLYRPDGRLVPQGWWSGGSCGFKGANRKSHEAGYQCAVRAFNRLEEIIAEKGPITLAVHLAGLGKGRGAVEGVFLTAEGEKIKPLVVELEDRTKIKIGGTRAKKPRRK
ncbi:hypothetical protein HYDPIDRAFT_105227 [Hydnomerulius pinastri MD-312]|nr:hypothetical protein HYDPIDRAFT_105227 [Hydnomerulius pinastri MD-312]